MKSEEKQGSKKEIISKHFNVNFSQARVYWWQHCEFPDLCKKYKKGVGLDGNIPSSNLSRAEQPHRHDLLIH